MGSVLVLGADPALRRAIEGMVPGTAVRSVRGVDAPDSERFGVDVVVVAGNQPLDLLMSVRLSQPLDDKPIVLYAPGHTYHDAWHSLDIWPVTSTGETSYTEVGRRVGWLLSRAHHPASARAMRSEHLAAS